MSKYKTVFIPCSYQKSKALGVEYDSHNIDEETLQKNLQFSLDEEDQLGYQLFSSVPIIGSSQHGVTQTKGIQLIFQKK